MADFRDYIGLDLTGYLMHYGVGHEHGGHSGRYPWGSGKRPRQDRGGSRQDKRNATTFMKSDSLHKSAIAAGFKLLPKSETREEALKNCNPYRGKFVGRSNCFSCAISGYLREHGIDAKSVTNFIGGVDAPLVISGSAVKDERKHVIKLTLNSNENARVINEAIPDIFGKKSSGIIMIRWKVGGGHVYNFDSNNGKTEFVDYQSGQSGKDIDCYFDEIDVREPIYLFRLDNAELDMSKLKKYLKAS